MGTLDCDDAAMSAIEMMEEDDNEDDDDEDDETSIQQLVFKGQCTFTYCKLVVMYNLVDDLL